MSVIGHGIVQYAQEYDAYVSDKKSFHGLLGNSFLRELFTFKQWQEAKKLYTLTCEVSTQFFKEISDSLWIAHQ